MKNHSIGGPPRPANTSFGKPNLFKLFVEYQHFGIEIGLFHRIQVKITALDALVPCVTTCFQQPCYRLFSVHWALQIIYSTK